MLRQIRSHIPSLPDFNFNLPAVILSRFRLTLLARRRIQPLPVDQIFVRSAVTTDLEAGGGRDNLTEFAPRRQILGGSHVRDQHGQSQAQEDDCEQFNAAVVQSHQNPHASHSHIPDKTMELIDLEQPCPTMRTDLETKQANNPEDADRQCPDQSQNPEVDDESVRQQQGVELEGTGEELLSFPVYLQTHFQVLYYLGLSPLRGDGTSGAWPQFVAFIIITGIGLCQATLDLKQYIVDEIQVGNLGHYVSVWYFSSCLFMQIYMLKLFAFDKKRIESILQMPEKDEHKLLFKKPENKFARESITLACITIPVSIAVAMRPDWSIRYGDTPEEIMRSYSNDVGKYLFLWSKDENQTAILKEQYGGDLNSTNLFMGSFGIAMRFFGSLAEYLIRDILLMSALHTYRLSRIYERSAQKLLSDEGPNDLTLDELRDRHGKLLNQAIMINDGLKDLFKAIHAESWLVCPYFLLDLLRGEIWHVYFIAAFITIPKIILAYSIAAEAIIKEQSTKCHIERVYDKKKCHEVNKVDVQLFLKVLEDHPIGIGRGQLLLDESFATRFIGVVISCFLLFESAEKNKPSQ